MYHEPLLSQWCELLIRPLFCKTARGGSCNSRSVDSLCLAQLCKYAVAVCEYYAKIVYRGMEVAPHILNFDTKST
jgi:hypothetical protein